VAIIRKPKTKQEKDKETIKEPSAQILKAIAKAEGIFNAIGDGINIIDKTFRVIYQNQVHKDMMGLHVGEFCYKTYAKKQGICGGCPVALTFKNGRVHVVQRELKTAKGTRYAEITTSPLKDSTGKIIAGIEIVRDVTERKEAEEALRASEAELHENYFAQSAINMLLSESLENIPLEEFLQKALNMILSIPWIAFEAIGSISLVEDQADTLIMKAQSNLPEPLKKLCIRVPFGKCLCGKAALTQKVEFADHIDERHEICYKGIVPHGHYSVPILSGGRTLGVLNIYLKEGHIRNQKEEEFLNAVANTLAGIIVRRKAEKEKEKLHDQLLQAQKMEAIGQLSGGIAHDFNNILTAILGFGNLVKIQVENDSTLSMYMKHILNSAEKAAKLTQDLLAFSRKQMISPMPINVNKVIKGVEKILPRLIGEDIELSIHISDKDLTVMADGNQMEHVLMNLATNARDAMPEGGNLLISSDFTEIDKRFINMYGYGEPGRYAVITVSDTGEGIDEQTKEKIFEPFFTTKEVGKGTGLGLAMVYGIVKQHDGFINVYSEPGKGTTFKIYLPFTHAEIADAKEVELPIPKGGTETILVSEDDALVRKFMRKVLEGAGYTVIEAKDGEDAIEVFIENKDRIKLLVLDVIMPKKNGKEVYETLKETTPYLKALFTSGYSADILHKKGIISEGPEVILKPISSNNLLRKIRDLLDQ
jgi:signal transduction histidine kinase